MKIKFLKYCNAPMENWRTYCECCGPVMDGSVDYDFFKDDEIDPNESYAVVDISKLKYKEDYEIVEYP